MKKKFITLDDGVDTKDFKQKEKKIKLIIHVFTLVAFIKERLEFILKLSKLLPKVNFYFYGDISTLDKKISYIIKKCLF